MVVEFLIHFCSFDISFCVFLIQSNRFVQVSKCEIVFLHLWISHSSVQVDCGVVLRICREDSQAFCILINCFSVFALFEEFSSFTLDSFSFLHPFRVSLSKHVIWILLQSLKEILLSIVHVSLTNINRSFETKVSWIWVELIKNLLRVCVRFVNAIVLD